MFHALIRPVETSETEVSGISLEDIQTQLAAVTPEGFDLVSASARMPKAASGIEATGRFARRDGVREIEAADMTALEALVPDGWQMLSVRED